MRKLKFNLRHEYLFICLTALALFAFAPLFTFAHQQPTTIALLDVNAERVGMELQIPLSELELAFGHDVTQDTDTLIARLSPEIKDYLKAHIHPKTTDNLPWAVEVTTMRVEKAEQTQSGPYQEITVHLELTPPAGANVRNFILDYDVIMHQVVTHKALVGIRRDWETGKTGEQSMTVGIIAVDTTTTRILPLEINLLKGDSWQGFKGMVSLGMEHIKTGTDHLLFLLTLLLPATLLFGGKKWGAFGGAKYSVRRLLAIVTAFTAGHSITLLIGASGWVRLPPQPIEILIAVSILISAVHAVRPLFPGREMYVAAGFGLVHGLAFAAVLSDLHPGAGEMALSILGFNVGIELMQLFIIALVAPWLILLSRTAFYKYIRIGGAAFAGVAAVAWIAERVSGESNAVGNLLQNITQYAPVGILIMALLAGSIFGWQYFKNQNNLFETQN